MVASIASYSYSLPEFVTHFSYQDVLEVPANTQLLVTETAILKREDPALSCVGDVAFRAFHVLETALIPLAKKLALLLQPGESCSIAFGENYIGLSSRASFRLQAEKSSVAATVEQLFRIMIATQHCELSLEAGQDLSLLNLPESLLENNSEELLRKLKHKMHDAVPENYALDWECERFGAKFEPYRYTSNSRYFSAIVLSPNEKMKIRLKMVSP